MASQATKPDQTRRRCDTALRALGSRTHGRRHSRSASTLAACHAAALPRPGSAAMKLFNAVTGADVVLYRLSGGKLGSGPVRLLEHTGRKSGRRRTTPVL